MKKGVRFIIKGLVALVFAGVLYSVHLQMTASHMTRSHKASNQKSKLDMQRLKIDEHQHKDKHPKSATNPQNTLLHNNAPFEERDMLDEHGNRFKIMIWIRHPGAPGYLANPRECLANISCQIVYASSNVESAHAVVFKADYVANNPLPDVR